MIEIAQPTGMNKDKASVKPRIKRVLCSANDRATAYSKFTGAPIELCEKQGAAGSALLFTNAMASPTSRGG